jgi:hypothetical protein
METMEVPKKAYQRIKDMMAYKIQNGDVELECRFMKGLAHDPFRRVLQYYTSLIPAKEQHETLDIISKFNRVTIRGKENIQKYCSTNSLSEGDVDDIVTKASIRGFSPVYLETLNFKVDLQEETPIKERSEVIKSVLSAPKMFRFKNRISLHDPKLGVRYDMTVVKSSISDDHLTFYDSKTVNAPEKYEFEIEYTSNTEDAMALIKCMVEAHMVINNNVRMVDKNKIITSYIKLLQFADYIKPHMVLKKPRRYLVGPKPVSLEMKNLTRPAMNGAHSIVDVAYTVTEKADGERHIMYAGEDGGVYMINNRFDIIPFNVKLASMKNSIFDGEWVEDKRIYALFDAYYVNGKDMRGLPLVGRDGRLSALKTFHSKEHKNFKEKGNTTLHLKDFILGGQGNNTTIFDATNDILQKQIRGEFPYHIDGVIYTPAYYPVGASYKEDSPNAFGTWSAAMKWKPASENSIDFLVKYVRDDKGNPKVFAKDGKMLVVCDLHVGYNPMQWEKVEALNFLAGKIKDNEDYYSRRFSPPEHVGDDASTFYAEEAMELDEKIVEFSYNTSGKMWEFMRVRQDKTELYQKNVLTDTANDFGTALSVWRCIQHPVTHAMVVGTEIVDPGSVPDDNVYYQRNTTRDKFASRPMMDFHNEGIKNLSLIANEKGKNRLLDLACGKGGDLNKWLGAGIKEVVGFDYVADNIENPTDGVYSRIQQLKKAGKFPSDVKYVFLPMDCSKPLDPSRAYSGNDQRVALALWDADKKDTDLAKYTGMMTQKFDVVSCQFAIHYFFETADTLDTFLANVDANIAEGGRFIGTCLDGHKVKAALGTKDKVVGKKGSRTIWEISKKFKSSKSDIKMGDAIDIYMESIGRVVQEYLVDTKLLQAKLEQRGYRMVFIKGFGEVYNDVEGRVVEYYRDSIKSMTDVEKQYSFLNVMFCFEKQVAKKKIGIRRRQPA